VDVCAATWLAVHRGCVDAAGLVAQGLAAFTASWSGAAADVAHGAVAAARTWVDNTSEALLHVHDTILAQSSSFNETKAALSPVVVERARIDLYERGLAAGRVLDGEFVRTLRALVTATETYYAFFHRRAENTRSALVVSSGVLVSVAGYGARRRDAVAAEPATARRRSTIRGPQGQPGRTDGVSTTAVLLRHRGRPLPRDRGTRAGRHSVAHDPARRHGVAHRTAA
jgi:hypothetical protein